MRILISNDDGIQAEGLKALINSLQEVEDIELYVAAPDRERSAAGHGITVHRPLRVKTVDISFGQEWAVDGTPADCVKLAIEALLPEPPDLVITGINQGPNLGTDVLYSGTVSAAIEGVINGFQSLAVSLASYTYHDFALAQNFIKQVLSLIKKRGIPSGTLLNINIPAGHWRGVKITRLGNRRYINVFDKRTDPRGRIYYWMGGQPMDIEDNNNNDTDVGAIKAQYISITPIQLDLTDYRTIIKLQHWPW
ncbi:5'-nucleotidase [Peptococcaceae bacterium SCADC1_2_3]|jgi:5'-nucleotidase|nr:5'-nucleotidase [Peptococcaceae bacterium SCADC1_2_3]KFI36267.1 5'-nucleotidase [Peptococcaceae bacterium SCADC1_2_3]HBQ28709.1 5'/3'-nucleotidase SurE [Desulfotomaculum sp.]HCJ79129.1 5'/3'-nucleotidase SurE [Desulfotomaculum sp.]